MLKFVKGDATNPPKTDKTPAIIIHICNDMGAWGKGFVLAVSKRWKQPEQVYRADTNLQLGKIQIVPVEDNITVINLIGQHKIYKIGGIAPIRYDAVANGLQKVADYIKQNKQSVVVHMPRIGCGLAGGEWSVMEPIIKKHLVDNGIDVVVYDF